MSLEKRIVLSHIEVNPQGVIFIRKLTQVIDCGKVESSKPHRDSFRPGEEGYEEAKNLILSLLKNSL